jgi:Na+/phosphate symporter
MLSSSIYHLIIYYIIIFFIFFYIIYFVVLMEILHILNYEEIAHFHKFYNAIFLTVVIDLFQYLWLMF